jgi:hypothetical protein
LPRTADRHYPFKECEHESKHAGWSRDRRSLGIYSARAQSGPRPPTLLQWVGQQWRNVHFLGNNLRGSGQLSLCRQSRTDQSRRVARPATEQFALGSPRRAAGAGPCTAERKRNLSAISSEGNRGEPLADRLAKATSTAAPRGCRGGVAPISVRAVWQPA